MKTREVSLAHLIGVDFYVSYWMPGPVGHTFVSFVFDNAPPVCISIEARPEVGEGYAPIASLFKQFELIYVVGDERDLVRVRTNYRRENVYLYHIATSPQNALRLFRSLSRADQPARRTRGVLSPAEQQLHDQHRQVCERAGSEGALRHPPLPERLDRRLSLRHRQARHGACRSKTLRQRSLIDQVAQEAGDAANFSERIRAALPPAPPKARPATQAARAF